MLLPLHNFKQCEFLIKRVIRLPQSVLLGRLYHVLDLSLQQLVSDFDLPHRTKYWPIRLKNHHHRHHIDKENHILGTYLVLLRFYRICNPANAVGRKAENRVDMFFNYLSGLLHDIMQRLESQTRDPAYRLDSHQELL